MNRYDVLAWFFPCKCLLCGEYVPAGQSLCPDCIPQTGQPVERNFNLPMGKKSRIFKAVSPWSYEGYYHGLILRFKFGGKTGYARKLAAFMKAVCGRYISGSTLVTCVPMEPGKKRRRGYNQAELLAKAVAAQIGCQYRSVLEVSGKRQIQHHLSAKERQRNSSNIYQVKSDIIGQNILLVDDIITTGATLCACAKPLYGAGAAGVIGLCAADTPKSAERGAGFDGSLTGAK